MIDKLIEEIREKSEDLYDAEVYEEDRVEYIQMSHVESILRARLPEMLKDVLTAFCEDMWIDEDNPKQGAREYFENAIESFLRPQTEDKP